MIQYKCPSCGEEIESPDSLMGLEEKCPGCGAAVAVPSPEAANPTAPPAPPPSDVELIELAETAGPGATVAMYCKKCKKDFDVSVSQCVLAVEPKADEHPKCPACQTPGVSFFPGFGCSHCWKPFFAPWSVLGKTVRCPHCGARLDLPAEDKFKELVTQGNQHKWSVKRATDGAIIRFRGMEDLVAAMNSGKVLPGDSCMEHALAVPRDLKRSCDERLELRKLYDPVAAYTRKGGIVTGVVLAVAYIVSVPIYGVMQNGGAFLLWLAFGLAGVVLTPTVIGLFIVYFVATACGVSLVGAYLGVLLGMLICFGVFLVGVGLGCGAVRVLGATLGLRKRAMQWGRAGPAGP